MQQTKSSGCPWLADCLQAGKGNPHYRLRQEEARRESVFHLLRGGGFAKGHPLSIRDAARRPQYEAEIRKYACHNHLNLAGCPMFVCARGTATMDGLVRTLKAIQHIFAGEKPHVLY